MRDSFFWVDIEFLPTSVDEKAMFGDKLTFRPIIVAEKTMFWAESEILSTGVNEKELCL